MIRLQTVALRKQGRLMRCISQAGSLEALKSLSAVKAQPVFVFFTASWCQPCRDTTPHLEDCSGPFLKMAQVDVNDLPDAAREFGRLDKSDIADVAEKHAVAFQKLQEESR
eukprot:s60_g44.t1